MKRSRFIALCLTLFLGTVSFAQTIKVSGTVTDSSNEPVIGVSVLVKGTTTGTSTDLDDVVVTGYMTEKESLLQGRQVRCRP